VSQRALVGFDVGEQPPQLGCLLRRHAAMLIETDRFIRHSGAPPSILVCFTSPRYAASAE
jgi:hypothetical protein